MKNKKTILVASVLGLGGLITYFFLSKPTTATPSLNQGQASIDLSSSKNNDVLQTSVVTKDNTEQFNALFKTYNEIKKQINATPKSIFGGNNKLESLRKDLKDFEYKIIALGYTPTGSGTFTQDNNSFIQKGNTEEEFNMLYRTYRSLEQQIIDKDKPIPLNILNGYGRKAGGRVLREQQKNRDEQLQILRDSLRDIEQEILNLGYTPIGRGTFKKR